MTVAIQGSSGEELLSDQTKSYCSHLDGYSVVSFPKEISKANLTEIREAGEQVVAELANRKAPHCLVDLTDLDHAGSALVASMVRIWKAVDAHQGRMVVAVSSKGVRDVLRVTGLNRVWTIKSSYDAALDELGFSTRARNVKRDLRLLAFVGPATLFVGAIAVALSKIPALATYSQPHDVIANSLIGMALITSGISIFRERSWRRWLSVFVFVLALSILGWLVGIAYERGGDSNAPSGGERAANSSTEEPESEPNENASSEETERPQEPESQSDGDLSDSLGARSLIAPSDDAASGQSEVKDSTESKATESITPPDVSDQPEPPRSRAVPD